MTRSLARLGLCCGLWGTLAASCAFADRPPRAGGAAKLSVSKEPDANARQRAPQGPSGHSPSEPSPSEPSPREHGHSEHGPSDVCQQTDRPAGDRADDGDRDKRDGQRHPGGLHPRGGHAAHLERRFIFEAVRRAGGPLELLPLLLVPEVRRELQIDEQAFKPKLDAYMLEMQKRIDENRRQAASAPKSRLPELFKEDLQRENDRFQEFLDELPPSQQDRLIYLFVQARNYRALSNRLVVAKMGMKDDEAADIRQEIEDIRQQTMEETRDRFRRIFDQGGGREQFENMVRENQRKMDARIEKKLTDAQREKFAELREKTSGQPPDWLLQAVDFPPGPNPPPRPKSKEPAHKQSAGSR